MRSTVKYLNLADVAYRLGVKRDALAQAIVRAERRGDPFPEPDAEVGIHRGWSESTLPEIRDWWCARPGTGWRRDSVGAWGTNNR
jgi:hypothetical protein